MRLRHVLLPLGLALFAPLAMGCATTQTGSPNALKYAEDAKKAYDKALNAFLDRDWEDARVLFAEVKRKYAYSRFARLAELRIADIDYEQEKFAAAITAYRAFTHDHRTDDSVPYARFRIARGLYSQINDTLLLPPQEERDQATTVDAARELTAFLTDYPQTKWTKEAKFMLIMVTGRLVRHELYVAKYYLRTDNFEASKKRVEYALHEYDGSGLEPEAMVLLGEILLKMHKQDEARKVFEQMRAVYPASPFTDAAKNFLSEMDRPGSAVLR